MSIYENPDRLCDLVMKGALLFHKRRLARLIDNGFGLCSGMAHGNEPAAGDRGRYGRLQRKLRSHPSLL